ncbi:transmembrane 9 superfamily member [Plakobranchus ocellatus]|uniref:Transmembrane 9 superfamily member n=1 Tax=Plakobranchus ocellatus TaxID=259542 RepID=A0AAV4AMY2_9GAST|nr:transmembrane 9 superfamily member [Plakobranchus ocellatus]
MTNTANDEKKWKSQVGIIDIDLAKLGKTDLVKRGGPMCSTFNKILNKNRITPKAYHGRRFISNHSHKYFKTNVHKQLTRHLMLQTLRCTDNRIYT